MINFVFQITIVECLWLLLILFVNFHIVKNLLRTHFPENILSKKFK